MAKDDIRLVLEIGTWFGGGSSWELSTGLMASSTAGKVSDPTPLHFDKWLVTLEIFEEAWTYASRTLERLPVTCLLGGTVGLDVS